MLAKNTFVDEEASQVLRRPDRVRLVTEAAQYELVVALLRMELSRVNGNVLICVKAGCGVVFPRPISNVSPSKPDARKELIEYQSASESQ